MTNAKLSKSIKSEPMHHSVGAIIIKENKYLLLDRVKPPFGFACPAGHVDEGEDQLTALKREVEEETGLIITNQELLFEEELDWNTCSKGINTHYWYVYKCETQGEIKKNHESKSMNWFTLEEIKNLKLEPVWEYWFKKLNILHD